MQTDDRVAGATCGLMEDSPIPAQMPDCDRSKLNLSRGETRVMILNSRFTGILLGMMLAGVASQAIAAQPLVIHTDQSKIIDLARAPGVVVVGNPSIADATIQGNRVFVHGRGYGTTNLIILDEDGDQIADFEIDVQLGGQNNVSLFKAGQLQSYVCAGDCQTMMHVGDNPEHFKDTVLERNKDKIDLATGQESAETDEPPPAQ
ncbi:MAG: pilus assembly protein N-terminal domain-containing protein [Rhizobiales bacterium]|nr:pilus assembly protein N-terminal domain-containing protein [Hyphomicrobiales bacterium]